MSKKSKSSLILIKGGFEEILPDCPIEISSADEGANVTNIAERVPDVRRTVSGQAFLGEWTWSLEYKKYYRW